MEHKHPVFDTDTHFTIDPITRQIKNASHKKTTLMQFDHNSERFTFECPRYIEAHDMAECNRVEVHYLNIDGNRQNSGVYTVDDLQVMDGDETQVTCSWVISSNATQLAGQLAFLLRFCCVDGDEITYSWNTDMFQGQKVSKGIDASGAFETEYVDVIEQWKASVMGYFSSSIAAWKDETSAAIKKESTDHITALITYASPQMYGAKGDGVTDDTEAINTCLANHSHVRIPEGTYIVDPNVSLVMRDNQVLEMSDNTVIKASVTDLTKYNYAITIKDVSNVTVRGGKICGDRLEYPDSTSERGYGIFIYNSRNVRVENCELSDFRGDNIIMESFGEVDYESIVNTNIRIEGCKIHNALRHGITVMGVRGLVIKDTEIYNTQGKSYSTAIDAEVHYEWQEMSDFRYENVRAYDCNNGVMFNQNSWKGTIRDVTIERCDFDRIQLGVAGKVLVNRSDIRIISVGGLDRFVANHCNIGLCYITHLAKKVITNKCVFDCTEDSPEAFTFEYSADASTVECEINDCVINSYASDVKDNLKNLFSVQCQPISLMLNGCTLNVNNPNGVKLAAQKLIKVFGCRFINKFNQTGYPSAILSVSASENHVVGNVFDTMEASATNNDKCIIESSKGNMFFVNNVGVMDKAFGVLLSFSAGESGRTWTLMNNVFPKYAGKGQTADGVTYINVGNIYSGTT